MNSSRKLSKYRIRKTLPSYKSRTDDQKRLLDERPVARREKFDRYLEEEPEYQQTENESIMRYNGNNGNLNVYCGRGSMQYYRQDSNCTVTVINVRLKESFTS